MKVLITNADGYKARIFETVSFPLLVEATPIKSGMMKGWIEVNATELDRVGCKVANDSYDWHLSQWEFSPNAFQVVQS